LKIEKVDVSSVSSEIIEESNYYPFGLKHKGYNNVVNANGNSVAQKRKFGGMELQDELGLDWYDFGARNYDASLGRWMNIDPMAEVMYDQSPFNYALNSPLMFIDPDGALPWPVHIRSFISAKSVGGGTFRGDGRGASTQSSKEGAWSRVSSTFTVDPAKGTSTAPVSTSDLTIFYGAGVPGTPTYIPPMAERPDPLSSISNVNASDSSVSLDFKHSAKDPITPSLFTPDLDVQASLNITEDLDNGVLNVSGTFTGDAFPSTEAFITDQSGKTNLLLGAHKEVGGIGKLFGENKRPTFSVNMQVNIDSKGNFTGVTQGDKTYTVQEWNKHVQDTFNK
ncbi:MAG: RHS repeat domain-containing protein, partial [Polaribacter sp.]